ncbi:hypothetical protein NMY22_g18125 [Coprinellus aureogranulatus]|nr:hypothetical protein NMY22_g18125 [Coprinellus aureogranulatus]
MLSAVEMLIHDRSIYYGKLGDIHGELRTVERLQNGTIADGRALTERVTTLEKRLEDQQVEADRQIGNLRTAMETGQSRILEEMHKNAKEARRGSELDETLTQGFADMKRSIESRMTAVERKVIECAESAAAQPGVDMSAVVTSIQAALEVHKHDMTLVIWEAISDTNRRMEEVMLQRMEDVQKELVSAFSDRLQSFFGWNPPSEDSADNQGIRNAMEEVRDVSCHTSDVIPNTQFFQTSRRASVVPENRSPSAPSTLHTEQHPISAFPSSSNVAALVPATTNVVHAPTRVPQTSYRGVSQPPPGDRTHIATEGATAHPFAQKPNTHQGAFPNPQSSSTFNSAPGDIHGRSTDDNRMTQTAHSFAHPGSDNLIPSPVGFHGGNPMSYAYLDATSISQNRAMEARGRGVSRPAVGNARNNHSASTRGLREMSIFTNATAASTVAAGVSAMTSDFTGADTVSGAMLSTMSMASDGGVPPAIRAGWGDAASRLTPYPSNVGFAQQQNP